jgi:two-component system chemotaxis sensor kinase CheA
MNALLQQFLSESRDFLQGISEKLMQLEEDPSSTDLMAELFRFVHTLKGNSGLFDFPEMTRVLHASEDLMDFVRHGDVEYSQELADQLLEGMDFVSMLLDEIETTGEISSDHADVSHQIATQLRALIAAHHPDDAHEQGAESHGLAIDEDKAQDAHASTAFKLTLPESVAFDLFRRSLTQSEMFIWLVYYPEAECFFKGEDPFYLARQIPQVVWRSVAVSDVPVLAEMDAYSCQLIFETVTTCHLAELKELFRYIPEQVQFEVIPPLSFICPSGHQDDGALVHENFVEDAFALVDKRDTEGLIRLVNTLLELSGAELWSSSVLRWLKLVLELMPQHVAVHAALLDALRTGIVPNWQTIADNAGVVNEIAPPDLTSTVALVDNFYDGDILEESVAELSLEVDEPDDIVMEPDTDTETSITPSADEIQDTPVDPQALANQNAALAAIVAAQREILQLSNNCSWLAGRLKGVASALRGCCQALHKTVEAEELEAALTQALDQKSSAPLLLWLDDYYPPAYVEPEEIVKPAQAHTKPAAVTEAVPAAKEKVAAVVHHPADPTDTTKAMRADDPHLSASKTLKVDQEKIDHLMNLIGEMVVAKNALPYLATRAEAVFGVRELSREIKAQYAVINRVAEEMQDTIMQVRMMPVSFIFQRFPRMVRDISRKLGKDIHLVLEGENTKADKNIIEALADPLVHIVRNSLDHGLETPDARRAAQKTAQGRLTIRASQESDRVLIEIIDDGRGIDPDVIKNKAYEKGLIDEATLERISDQEAINLIFMPGFSTADVISDLSGRGVGMDVVRTAVEKVNGSVSVDSQLGKGTRLSLSLPLSMAVTNVMIIESNSQIFGVPMDMVVETVRVPRSQISTIKQQKTTVLRGKIVPLLSLNELLAQDVVQVANEDDELATLIVRVYGENVGVLVDNFRETVDIILKPMTGILGGLSGYSGAALLGDGSVLMVLNPRELI